MHVTFDKAENFEALLSSEFESLPRLPKPLPGEDDCDAGYKLVAVISEDLALDMMVLDFE